MADALGSGPSARKGVEVQILSLAPVNRASGYLSDRKPFCEKSSLNGLPE